MAKCKMQNSSMEIQLHVNYRYNFVGMLDLDVSNVEVRRSNML